MYCLHTWCEITKQCASAHLEKAPLPKSRVLLRLGIWKFLNGPLLNDELLGCRIRAFDMLAIWRRSAHLMPLPGADARPLPYFTYGKAYEQRWPVRIISHHTYYRALIISARQMDYDFIIISWATHKNLKVMKWFGHTSISKRTLTEKLKTFHFWSCKIRYYLSALILLWSRMPFASRCYRLPRYWFSLMIYFARENNLLQITITLLRKMHDIAKTKSAGISIPSSSSAAVIADSRHLCLIAISLSYKKQDAI